MRYYPHFKRWDYSSSNSDYLWSHRNQIGCSYFSENISKNKKFTKHSNRIILDLEWNCQRPQATFVAFWISINNVKYILNLIWSVFPFHIYNKRSNGLSICNISRIVFVLFLFAAKIETAWFVIAAIWYTIADWNAGWKRTDVGIVRIFPAYASNWYEISIYSNEIDIKIGTIKTCIFMHISFN